MTTFIKVKIKKLDRQTNIDTYILYIKLLNIRQFVESKNKIPYKFSLKLLHYRLLNLDILSFKYFIIKMLGL